MAVVTIQDIDDQLVTRLRNQTARHGHSMEEEARDILHAALSTEPAQGRNLVDSIRGHIESLGGVELDLPKREAIREPSGFRE
ncbi:VapB protein (antitoxin to VapC) [Candidatus Paraburkholderia schumanniana]|nr:VapB protein (antitoxin to VapC) [Candidatus Paraburkholderia schumannianae]